MTDWYGYPYIALTGGTDGALDSLDGSLLKNGDFAVVVVPTTNICYIYTLDEDSAAAESSPDVISPDSNAGDKRWVLTTFGTSAMSSIAFTQSGTGAVSRTALEKARDFLTPQDFGAVGDGNTNDAGAWQYALNVGGVIDGLGKTYKVNTALTGGNNTTIRNARFDFSAAANGTKFLTFTGSMGNATAFNAAVAGAASFNTADVSGMAAKDYLYLESTDAFALNGTTNGEFAQVSSLDSNNNTVTPYRRLQDAYNNNAQFYTPAFKENIVVDNVSVLGRGNGYNQYALEFNVCKNVCVSKLQSEHFGDRHLQFKRTLHGSVADSVFLHSDESTGLAYGVAIVDGSEGITVNGCKASGVRHGVTVGGSSGVCRYITVNGCTVTGALDAGLDCHPNADHVAFTGNIVSSDGVEAALDGIVMQGAHMVCVGNTIRGFERIGVFMQSLVERALLKYDHSVITGNIIERPNGTGPIYGIFIANQRGADDMRFTVSGNTIDVISVTDSIGVYIQAHADGTNFAGGVIGSNTIYAYYNALYFYSATDKIISSVAVTGNSIQTVDTSTYATIQINSITNLYIQKMIIVGNSIVGGKYGINNVQGSRIKADANMIQGFGTSSTNGTIVGTNDNYDS